MVSRSLPSFRYLEFPMQETRLYGALGGSNEASPCATGREGCARKIACAVVGVVVVLVVGCARVSVREITPAGKGKRADTAALESAAGLLQSNAPAEQLKIYLSGLHVMKQSVLTRSCPSRLLVDRGPKEDV